MGKFLKSFLKVCLAVISIVNVIIFTVSIVISIISLNPGVKWNEYFDEISPGFYCYYFHTLWTSLDANAYEGKAYSGIYAKILNPHHDETWKIPIKNGLHKTIGLNSGGLLLLLIGITLHFVTKQKMFTIVVDIGAVGLGITGGCLCLKAINDYGHGIPGAIAKRSRPYYFPEKENMEIGYNLAKYSALMTIIASALTVAFIGLYIPFGEGKWIWQKKTNVQPDTERKDPPKTNIESVTKTKDQRRKIEGKMIKVKECRSK
ncbi:uncharacterized protein LOC143055057 [Mytilus galloprovincialis]|uniref:uncharacterized protein LOC143055057 n=1 Tax=Mytilus galloprovincialis TaxID=29158 RepID=UPI003F7BBC4E